MILKRLFISCAIALYSIFVAINTGYADSPGKPPSRTKAETKPQNRTMSQLKEDFKEWVLQNTAVTYLEYPGDSNWEIWVKLTIDKYTSKENVELIAMQLARAYKIRTGYKELVIVSVWYPYGYKIYAKGRL